MASSKWFKQPLPRAICSATCRHAVRVFVRMRNMWVVTSGTINLWSQLQQQADDSGLYNRVVKRSNTIQGL